jgi:2Fe-2S type ferredoxin
VQSPTGCKKFEATADKNLLEGALAAGLEVPNLCRTGTCGACASRLVSGNVERSDFLLDDEQKEAGFILLCTTTVTSDAEIKTHQETEMHTVPYGL